MHRRIPKICFLVLLFLTGTLAAQKNPLVGTWEMVSVSGINAEGERFHLDNTTNRETKIPKITPCPDKMYRVMIV